MMEQFLSHRDLRLEAGYQDLSDQTPSDAVKRLDTVFGDLRYPGVTEAAKLIEAEAGSA